MFSERIVAIVASLAVPIFFGVMSVSLGQDTNYDLLFYHYSNAYAFLNNRVNYDLVPAGLPTYYNPYIDALYFLATNHLGPKTTGFILGVIHGLNFIVLFKICSSSLNSFNQSNKFALALALAGVLSVGFLSEIGTTFNDDLISLFPLLSLLIIISAIGPIQSGLKTGVLAIISAGIVAGLGCGLKLTMALYALALCLAFSALPIAWGNRIKCAAIFGIAVLFGFLLADGYWLYGIWDKFGNPFFPQFNNIFHGVLGNSNPLSATSQAPSSVVEKLFYPFIFTQNPSRVGEFDYKQISWVILYIAVIFFFLNRLFYFFKRTPAQRSLCPETAFLLSFLCFGYLFWLNVFGVYRYIIPIEILIPLVLFVILTTLFKQQQAQQWIMMFLAAITIINLRGVPDWGHSPWGEHVFSIEAPELKEPEPAAVFLAGHPLAWVIPALDISAPFIQLDNAFASEAYWERAKALLSGRKGKYYVISEGRTNVETAISSLARLNLAIDFFSCKKIPVYFGAKEYRDNYCEVKAVDADHLQQGVNAYKADN